MIESCAYFGCHVDNGVSPATNFHSYEGLSNYLLLADNMAEFRSRVLEDLKDNTILGMPPDLSPTYPNSMKDNLTQEELEIIECWLDAGFPEG